MKTVNILFCKPQHYEYPGLGVNYVNQISFVEVAAKQIHWTFPRDLKYGILTELYKNNVGIMGKKT